MGAGVGRTAPGDTLQGGDTRRNFFVWLNLHRRVEKRGRRGRKVWVTPYRGGGDTRVKAIKMTGASKKGRQLIEGRKLG